MSNGFKAYAPLAAAVLALALSAPAGAQTSRDSPRPSVASDTSACSPLSGRQRESCMQQIQRDDAQRGISSGSASRGSGGMGSSMERCDRMSGKARADCMAESRGGTRGSSR